MLCSHLLYVNNCAVINVNDGTVGQSDEKLSQQQGTLDGLMEHIRQILDEIRYGNKNSHTTDRFTCQLY